MRSMCEARWASFFDELGWSWSYEPIELDGYIPDFILNLERPVLVEVKSDLDGSQSEAAHRKITASGWKEESIVTLAEPNTRGLYTGQGVRIGSLHDPHWGKLVMGPPRDTAVVNMCVPKGCSGGHFGLTALDGYFGCRVCNRHPKIDCRYEDADPAIMLRWIEAKNKIQWKGNCRKGFSRNRGAL